ncbi:hypothetical protein SMACR_03658 [Sordaria macrospora]|uniref:WGS project CABT00000000 data, contig 2.9 n=2 Tax=Sordaria macrospora TaxID=5147 RepID=F7VVT5_SORMK|nr:uncharacterized protein SMAC_03658 [Sordaria macrospora k-hell]KAA8635126.1 hypothetical protein SMACR_03658 [Sordaria macrospora]KAH7625737.1 hypothetical protein B0T09DRAFT_273025 [Sordaria sp. MPI-SDFR-AT-0083]WPJ66053.1 hypothetical protein SMAC4_03658 [Sordaria macrospora]CCC09626.1 unnamed protein product [Sordaria macrospora k-hell]
MAPFKPDAPAWLTGSAKKEKKKKPQVARSPEAKMPIPDSKLSQSVSVSAKKKKNKSKKKKPKTRAGGDLADDEQPSDVSGFVKGQSPTLSTNDATFVTVEESDPQEEEVARIKKEPVSPTIPKENAPPLRSESRIPLPPYPPYEPATKRSASPSPSSQLQVENPLMSLVKNINVRNEKHQSPSKATTKSMQKFLNKLTPTVLNSTLDQTQTFPPTSPLNTKTPLGQMPNRMLQFDSSPNNRFSPSKSENKCTPVPLPITGGKGFPAAPRLGTPFRATAGTQEDPLTPADIDAILHSVASKKSSDNGSERGVVMMHGYIIEDAHEANVGMTNTTIVKHEQQQEDSATAEALSKKSKKSKKGDKKRRLEESNALEEDDTITVSAAKKAKKSRKNKKAKMIGEEEEHHYQDTMDLDGPTQLDDTTVIAETTQIEVDMQLDEEVMQLVKNDHAGHASETVTVSAPKEDVEETLVDESASAINKKKTKKSRKAKKGQVEVEEHQHIQDDEQAANVINVANSKHKEQVTDVAAATNPSPATEPKVSKKGRKPKTEEQDSEQDATLPSTTASNVAATMAASNPLLSIAKQVVKFDNNLSFHTETFQTELSTIKNSLASLEQRIQANELRASVRHEILFNAMNKIATDMHTLGTIVCSARFSKGGDSNSHNDHDINNVNNSPDSSSPGSVERDRLQRSVRATAVAPSVGVGRKGYGQSMTPIPLPRNGNGIGQRVFSSHHGGRQTPALGVKPTNTNTAGGASAGLSGAAMTQGRKNQEKLLKGFTAEMDVAKDPKTVEIKGKLCVKYADDLFKML